MSLPPEDLQFGDLVVAQGLCSRERVDECVSFIGRLLADGVRPVPRLGELLVRKGYLSSSRFDSTLKPAPAPAASPDAAALPPEAAAAAVEPSNLIGKYVKVAPIGAGGMGEVWRAWDRELGRWAALKFLHTSDPGHVARFRREAQTAAALSHPNIASVYEVGEAQGKPYIALQLVAGPTLAGAPRDDLRRLAGLVRDAARAVHYAHGRGVIHRDLKPANLMVEGERVYVMDFGLAKPTAVDSSLSVSGAILGTPSYMPPEQARGKSSDATPANDVYSLGATLYELIAGRPPFEGKDVYEVLRDVVEKDPAPPRARNPRIPADLETITLKCLEKDPARRYASARALADDLDRWLKGEAIDAHPPSVFYRIRKFAARRKAVVATSAAALIALGILIPAWRAERDRGQGLAELGEIRAQLLIVREWTRQAFRTPEEIRAALKAHMERASAFVERRPGMPQAYYVRAQGRFLRGSLEGAEEDLRAALRLEPGFAPGWAFLARVKLETYNRRLASVLDDRQKDAARREASPLLLEAEAALRAGWKAGEDAASVERWGLARTTHDDVADTLARALRILHLEKRVEDALRVLREANERTPAPEYCYWIASWSGLEEARARRDQAVKLAPLDPDVFVSRGYARLEANDSAGAREDFDEAVRLDPGRADLFIDRAHVPIRAGSWDLALEDLNRGVALDPRHPLGWLNRSYVRLQRREFKEAERDAGEAIRLRPDLAFGYSNRAGARVELHDHAGAIADATKALELSPDLPQALRNRATARLEEGDLGGAAEDIDRVLAVEPRSADALVTRSGVRFRRKDLAGALKDVDAALEIDGRHALAYANRAAIRGSLGLIDDALADANRAVELDARSPRAFIARSFVRLLRMDVEPALADASKAIELDAGQARGYINRSTAWIYKGDVEKARADAERAVALAPKDAMARAARANAKAEGEDWAGAIEDATAALALDGEMPEAWALRAGARVKRKEWAGVIADATRAIERAPGLALAWAHRGEARLERGDARGAAEDCSKAVELVPALHGAWAARSRAREALGDRPGAAADLEKALEAAPPDWPDRAAAARRLAELRRP